MGNKEKGYLFHQRPLFWIFLVGAGLVWGVVWADGGVTGLPNGLKVLVRENPGTASVSADLWVRVGSRNEPASLNGIAHFVEHLLFKGTSRRSAQDISREVAAVGGFINAYTHWEYTQIHLSLLPAHLELGLDILADMTRNSAMTGEMV
jgi:predicted Zn-dependent peptidase